MMGKSEYETILCWVMSLSGSVFLALLGNSCQGFQAQEHLSPPGNAKDAMCVIF